MSKKLVTPPVKTPAKQPATDESTAGESPATAPIARVEQRIGEAKGNLARRSSWFRKRTD